MIIVEQKFKCTATIAYVCQVGGEGKYLVRAEKGVDIQKCTPNTRVSLRSDNYALYKILPTKVDPLVSLMKVEKVPDSTYDLVGGLDKQIQEIKEVSSLPLMPFTNCSRASSR